MKKEMKRYFASMALTAAMTAAMSFPAFAARIAFSDPSGNVGDEITGSDGETINSSDVMLSYDSSALEFVSGTGATGGAGSLRVVGNADTTGATELSFALKFKALKAGNSQIKVSTQEVYDKDGQTLTGKAVRRLRSQARQGLLLKQDCQICRFPQEVCRHPFLPM